MIRFFLTSVICVLLVLDQACVIVDDATPVCVPGVAVECTCASGNTGQKVCHDHGLGYSDCSCRENGPDAVGSDSLDTGQ